MRRFATRTFLYILASTYIVLNLFIAVAVEALERQSDDDAREIVDEIEEGDTEILAALTDLRDEVASLRVELATTESSRGRC